ncbi:MAG: beta/gamma crystallin-related protein [Gammaproteobacteria bacterium]
MAGCGPGCDGAIATLYRHDSLSSLKTPQGLVVRLYEHYHFQGRFIDIKEDTPVVSRFWNDRTSSIIVHGEADIWILPAVRSPSQSVSSRRLG